MEKLVEVIDTFLRIAPKRLHDAAMYYHRGSRVKNLQINPESHEITASIFESRALHKVSLKLNIEQWHQSLYACTCASERPCEHFYAAITNAREIIVNQLKTSTAPKIDSPQIDQWCKNLQNLIAPPTVIPAKQTNSGSNFGIAYLLHHVADGNRLRVTIAHIRLKMNGDYGSGNTAVTCYSAAAIASKQKQRIQDLLTNEDWNIIAKLLQENAKTHHFYSSELIYTSDTLKLIADTGRLHFESPYSSPLKWKEPIKGEIRWELTACKSHQIVKCLAPNHPNLIMLSGLTPICYLDPETNTLGLYEFDVPHDIVRTLAAAPAIPLEASGRIAEQFKTKFPSLERYAPPSLNERIVEGSPSVKCTAFRVNPDKLNNFERSVFSDLFDKVFLDIRFIYEKDLSFPPKLQLLRLPTEADYTVQLVCKGELVTVHRMKEREQEVVESFKAIGMGIVQRAHEAPGSLKPHIMVPESGDSITTTLIQFIERDKPKLEEMGYEVVLDNSLPFTKVVISDDWYVNSAPVKADTGESWFDISMGIMVDGKQLNLLPTLIELSSDLEEDDFEHFFNHPNIEDMTTYLQTTNGELVQVPMTRLRDFYRMFYAQFSDHNLSHDGTIRLSDWDATFISLCDEAQAASRMRWHGPKQLQEKIEKIRALGNIEAVKTPHSLQCQLRHYQEEGLAWLQFLRKTDLNGILADDMGLGKTMQTLAHILIEKESGRMTSPSLIICPTSLIPNWYQEIQRFAPSLSTLILHGSDRKHHFERIVKHDVILTTYPLLMHDKETLQKEKFHIIILDEAQTIKNNKTQAYQVVQMLQANHRICLTGTPMENHLGEVWSLFNFLMPGFLGDHKSFTHYYRRPIEKDGDQQRREILCKRLRPFMLRRTKQQVAVELPTKTEIVHNIELDASQRDLYEIIRLRAQKTVMDEIAKKGLDRSRIIILDALLKLRQVCCDPRLLKITGLDSSAFPSAKLRVLMEMLPQMIEEGRQILVFSQFTSMLGLIEQELTRNQISYTLLTGDTADRAAPVQVFQSGKVPVMLLSLKAGGVGLNLTAADTVILYDPWWNPAVEAQAMDRSHRIGQTKPVFVYKMVAVGSVEEKILGMQQRKKDLFASILDDKATDKVNFTLDDLQDIFTPLPQ